MAYSILKRSVRRIVKLAFEIGIGNHTLDNAEWVTKVHGVLFQHPVGQVFRRGIARILC